MPGKVDRARPDESGSRERPARHGDIENRVAALEWTSIASGLDTAGYATIPAMIDDAECAALAAMYDQRERFRSRVVMERFRYGVGEYKYFAAPLPPIVAALRAAIYARLAPIANRWADLMHTGVTYPAELERFLDECNRAGQTKPTPLMLRYGASGYNCLHQDVYGAVAFPLQMTILLSRPGADFSGGEFLLVENRPRAQSRGEAIVLGQGDTIVFPNSARPVAGARGHYRLAVRHGVSRIRSGLRMSLGVIFHDAK